MPVTYTQRDALLQMMAIIDGALASGSAASISNALVEIDRISRYAMSHAVTGK